jgi:thiamine biosynthesis protein ThiS
MTIIINGERKTIQTPINITDFLETLNISEKLVAVAINGEIIPKTFFGTTLVLENDKVEIVSPVGGG